MDKTSNIVWTILKWLFGIMILFGLGWLTWQVGVLFDWSWGEFWSNFITNTASSAVIGFVLYWIITRPDEKKAKKRGGKRPKGQVLLLAL